MTQIRTSPNALSALVLAIIVPLGGSFVLQQALPEWTWAHVPFHATVEALGAAAAISLAVMLLVLGRDQVGSGRHGWIASGLIGMGILDGFHACVPPGVAFVWLHSAAVLVGGAFFALVWLPDSASRSPLTRAMPGATAIVISVIALYSVAAPEALPGMVSDGNFTGTARALNILGGLLFLVAAARLIADYRGGGNIDGLLFASLCLLFGTAGVLFEYSHLWDSSWWLWHLLRLIAYLIALCYVFVTFRNTGRELRILNESLGQRVEERTRDLEEQTRQISEGAGVLASSTSEISASTSQIASGTSETATAVSQTTATVEELKQTIQLASQKAQAVAGVAQQAAATAEQGRQSVAQVNQGMSQIQEHMAAVGESIVQLSEQSQAIGQIIATVDDLAEQSNLLAVNAAIEAARAGDEGKSFGVVAEEIRNLAEQSKAGTAQVRSILSDVQKATSAAVMAAEQGSKAVEAGVLQAGQAGEAIDALTNSVVEASGAAAQISASAQQQQAGVDQVAAAMDNIKQASTQNAASMQQAEKAAKDLNEVGDGMRELMARYKLS